MKIRILTTIAAFASLLSHASAASPPDSRTLLDEMSAAVERTQDYSLLWVQRERFDEGLGRVQTMHVKYSRGRVYLHILEGKRPGAEVLYPANGDSTKAKVHKGSFPDITISVDLHSSLLMDGRHHPVNHANFQYLASVVMDNVRRGAADPEWSLSYAGTTIVGARTADVVEMKGPWRSSVTTVQAGEDLWRLAQRVHTDAHLLLYANGLKRPSAITPGRLVQVPRYYGARTILAIDRQIRLPLRLAVYDGNGNLYESYELQQIDTSPLRDEDFDPANRQYRF